MRRQINSFHLTAYDKRTKMQTKAKTGHITHREQQEMTVLTY